MATVWQFFMQNRASNSPVQNKWRGRQFHISHGNAIITLTMYILHKLSRVMSFFPPSSPHRWASQLWLWGKKSSVCLRRWKRILCVKHLKFVAESTATPASVWWLHGKPDSAWFARPDWNNQSAKCLFWSLVWRGSTKERMNCVPIESVRCLAQAESGRYLQFCWPFTEICFCVISAWMGDIKFAKIIEPIGAETLPTPFWRRRVGAPNKGCVCFKKEIKNEGKNGEKTHTLAEHNSQSERIKKIPFQSNNALWK